MSPELLHLLTGRISSERSAGSDYVTMRIEDAEALVKAASRAVEYEAFFREHGSHLEAAADFTSDGIEEEMPGHPAARDALKALLERLPK